MMIILNIATLRGCHMLFFFNNSVLGIIMLSSLLTRSFNFKGMRYCTVLRAWISISIPWTSISISFQGEEIPYCLESMDFGTEIDGTQDFFQVKRWQLWPCFECYVFVFAVFFQLLRGCDCVIGDFMISLDNHFVYLVFDIC